MIKKMNYQEFANYILDSLSPDRDIQFATCWEGDDENKISARDCSGWYFASAFYLEKYNSKFILLDYCGGEEAFAIPVSGFGYGVSQDDRMFVPTYVATFFEQCCSLGSKDDCIFCEL